MISHARSHKGSPNHNTFSPSHRNLCWAIVFALRGCVHRSIAIVYICSMAYIFHRSKACTACMGLMTNWLVSWFSYRVMERGVSKQAATSESELGREWGYQCWRNSVHTSKWKCRNMNHSIGCWGVTCACNLNKDPTRNPEHRCPVSREWSGE